MRKVFFILSLLIALQYVSFSQITDYGYPIMPDLTSTSTNTILPMGGAFNVGELGNATYSLPIEVPAGINDMQPSLSINYNSLAGNGICGLGFNIGGLSAISRVSGNYYYDGMMSDMVANSNYIALAMDGQRLINGSNGKYYVENDPNTDITLKNDTITVKQNGKLLIYRKINNNYQVYYLSNITDVYGNKITYNYFNENGFVYISAISYGIGTGFVTISFVYETRSDVVNCFNKIPIQIKKRLCRIDVKKNSTLWRSYGLSYSYSNGLSKVVSITEKNSKGEQKYPAEFSWGISISSAFYNKTEVSVPNSSDFSFEDTDIIPGDVNNDGIEDIVFVDRHFAYLYLSDKNTSLTLYKKIELAKDIDYDKRLSDLLKYIVSSQFITDVDGDGMSELLVVSQPFLSERNKGLNKISYDVSISAYNTLVGSVYDDYRYGSKEPEMPAITIGDFFSMGKECVLCIGKTKDDKGKYTIYIQGLGRYNSNLYNNVQISLVEQPECVLNGDFDGDGLLDILVVAKRGSTIFWNNGCKEKSDYYGVKLDAVYSDSYKTSVPKVNLNCAVIRVGDFDGDGVSEILYNTKGETTLNILKNKGNRSFASSVAIDLTGIYDITDTNKDDERFCVEVTDFNCDGKADILVSKAMYKQPGGKNYYRHSTNYDFWLKSEGDKFSIAYKREWGGEYAPAYHRFVIGDFNGDGYQEVMRLDVNGKLYVYNPFYSESYANSFNKITRISEQNGKSTSITYGNLSDPKVYSKWGTVKYPMVEIVYPLSVVSSTTQSNGIAPSLTANYKYKYLLTHLRGKGVLGYEMKEVRYPELAESTVTMIDEWNMDYYVPSKIRTTSTGAWFENQETILAFSSLSDKRYLVYPSKCSTVGRYGNKTTITNTYNPTKGYIESSKTVFSDNSYKLTKYQNYVLAGGVYQPRLIVTEQKHPDDNNTYSTQQYFEYNTNKGFITKTIENYKTDFALTTLYKYDNYGNITEQSTFGRENDTMSTIYKYDSSRRLPTEKKSKPLNTVTRYTYDQFDNLTSETDATNNSNLLKTTYKYDGWGLNTEIIYPDSTRQSTIRGWSGNRYFVASLGTATPWSKVFYDNAGHIVKEETIGLSSSCGTSTSTMEYDYDIHVKPTKTVFKSGSYEETTTNKYDYDGSLVEHSDNAHSITYRYSANKTEVTDNGRKTTTEYDDWGGVKKVTSPDGSTVSYKYFSNGKPKSVTSLGATVSLQYYPNSLKKSITDSDAGTESYEYDSFGRIIQQKRGGITTTNTYSKGLLTKSKCGDITTTYSYDKQNRLTKQHNGTSSISYAYDRYDRTTKETYSIDGKNFTYQYSYNEIGQLASKTFPDNSVEKYTYNKYGFHTSTYLAGACTWTWYVDQFQKEGRHVTETTDGVFRDMYFNPDNTLRYVRYSSPNGGSSSDRIDYTYDRYQNVVSRKGEYTGTESFQYDASDRLIKIGTDHEYQYAQNGNILYQTGVGEYEYKASQPHAISAIDNDNGVVKSLFQHTTYTPFQKPETITDDSSPDSVKTFMIYYSPDNERIKSVYACNKENITTYYLPDYEVENANGVITTRHYLYSDFGHLVAVNFRQGNKSETYYAVTDHQGSVLKLVDSKVKSKYEATFTPFGVRTIVKNNLGYNFPRGYTMHEHLDQFGVINANARLYDPYLARFLSPDPYIQEPTNPQNFNRFSYCLNNPLKYSDPTGELAWFLPMVIGGAVFGTGNLASHVIRGDVNNWGNGLKYFGQGATAGVVLAAAWQFTPMIPLCGKILHTYMNIHYGSMVGCSITSLFGGLIQDCISGTWNSFGNAGKTFLGNFYLDENASFWGGVMQGISRHTWESLQTNLGHNWNQLRNIWGGVDRVEYFGGATYCINENSSSVENGDGMTLGSFIQIRDPGNVNGEFEDYMKTACNGTYLHEYGHTIQGRYWGLSYLFAVGIPSLINAAGNKPHEKYWCERWASRRAKKYFGPSIWTPDIDSKNPTYR